MTFLQAESGKGEFFLKPRNSYKPLWNQRLPRLKVAEVVTGVGAGLLLGEPWQSAPCSLFGLTVVSRFLWWALKSYLFKSFVSEIFVMVYAESLEIDRGRWQQELERENWNSRSTWMLPSWDTDLLNSDQHVHHWLPWSLDLQTGSWRWLERLWDFSAPTIVCDNYLCYVSCVRQIGSVSLKDPDYIAHSYCLYYASDRTQSHGGKGPGSSSQRKQLILDLLVSLACEIMLLIMSLMYTLSVTSFALASCEGSERAIVAW